jgi:SNF2 family DNA or RNA helicase
MRFLSPKILGYKSFYSFQANHLEYHPKFKGMITRAHNTDFIAAKIKPYVYQVTKEECLDLPNKIYESRYVGMSIDQRVLYEQAKNEILLEINDDEFDSFTIFRLFTALQQIACGFWNRRNADKVMEFLTFKQHRIAALMETISNIPSNEKIIIWAKYLYDIEQINTALTTEYGNDAVSQFHGRLSEQEKISQIDKFRGPARFFLATPSSGGHGLTLNEACYVIFYNNGFKYSERIQAEDRCHRIGQTRKVVYIDLVCVPSIDERISQALAKKENVVAKFKAEIDKVKKEGRRALIKNL